MDTRDSDLGDDSMVSFVMIANNVKSIKLRRKFFIHLCKKQRNDGEFSICDRLHFDTQLAVQIHQRGRKKIKLRNPLSIYFTCWLAAQKNLASLHPTKEDSSSRDLLLPRAWNALPIKLSVARGREKIETFFSFFPLWSDSNKRYLQFTDIFWLNKQYIRDRKHENFI